MIRLSELKGFVQDCKRCRLWKKRNNVVFGEGHLIEGRVLELDKI